MLNLFALASISFEENHPDFLLPKTLIDKRKKSETSNISCSIITPKTRNNFCVQFSKYFATLATIFHQRFKVAKVQENIHHKLQD